MEMLEAMEVVRCVLLCMVEAMEVLEAKEVLEVLKVIRGVLLCMVEAMEML